MLTELLIQTGFYQLRSIPLARKRCINLYPQVSEDETFSKISLLGTPGVLTFKDTGLGSRSRGCITVAGVPYYVVGTNFISLASDGTVTNHGTIAGTSDVSMSYNTKTIAIVVPDGNSYFFTVATTTLTQISDATFLAYGQVTTVNYKKGYFIFTTDTQFFSSSHYDTNNGQNFDALDFDAEDIAPDNITATFTSHDLLYVLGTETTALYDNITTTLFPFAEIQGANLEIGCTARHSITKFNNDFMFMGGGKNENPAIWRISNTGIVRVSTDAIEHLLTGMTQTQLDGCIADTYSMDGHVFALFTVGNYTLVYDDTSSAQAGVPIWHERQSSFTNGLTHKRWRGQHICKAYNKLLVGDNESGIIGYLDMDTYLEFGNRIERVVVSQPINVKGSPLFQSFIEMFIETGVGNSDSTDPAWLFSYTDDGKTWTNAISRAMGKVGEYTKRLVWRRMGRIPASRVLRWKTDDPVKIAIYKWVSEIG
jgi:hypothetical protein